MRKAVGSHLALTVAILLLPFITQMATPASMTNAKSTPVPPNVITDNATNVSANSATLNGRLISLGSSANVTVSFQWGLIGYTAETTPTSMNATTPFSFTLTGLAPLTTYHFHAKAVGDGTNWGSDQTFTTSASVPVTTPPFLFKWGSWGTGDGQFSSIGGVAFDGSSNVYVADGGNNRIQKFTSAGVFITKFGTQGSGGGQFNGPNSLAFDGSGNVYVADGGNNRIQKFTSVGGFITGWGYQGSGEGQLNGPIGVAIDNSGSVYVAEYYNHRIQKFTSAGVFITKWGTQGSGDGQFNGPMGVAVDAAGNVYVADYFNHRIQKFTGAGVFITKWGTQGSGDGQFQGLNTVAVDAAGNVYVADSGNKRIQVFGATIPPAITTGDADNISPSSARMTGTLTNLGTSANVTLSFQWGLSENYAGETSPVSVNATGAFNSTLDGVLVPDTAYHYRAKAVGHGTSYGNDLTFHTESGLPAVTTVNATAVSGISALLCGTLVDLGGNPSVQLSFQYGTSTNYISETTPFAASATGPFSTYLTGMSENTSYHFRVKAVGASTAYGMDRSFTTEVVQGVRIEGLTYEAKGVVLDGVTITLDGTSYNASDSNGIYRITATTTGSHSVVASKIGFRSVTQTVNAANIPATHTVHFKGDSGLVPNAPDASYVLACINRWKFPPTDGTGLSLSKVLQVINAWKFPL